MIIDIDIMDAIEQYVVDQCKQSKMFRDSPTAIREYMERLLDVAYDYNEAARIILCLTDNFEENHPGYLAQEREAIEQCELEEKDMPGGF